jgi:hypothetical protein
MWPAYDGFQTEAQCRNGLDTQQLPELPMEHRIRSAARRWAAKRRR